jgi:hypothetical protein
MKRYAAAALAALCTAVFFSGTVQGQQAGTIKITGPAAGSTVAAPVTLNVDIGGVTVKPAAEGDPAAFHYHALVDVDAATVLVPGQPIPTGQANIVHTADRALALPTLTPGQHTVTVVLTRTDHVPLNPSVQDRVTFTVGQGAAAVPRVGTGGGLDADGATRTGALLALAALALLAGGYALRRNTRT